MAYASIRAYIRALSGGYPFIGGLLMKDKLLKLLRAADGYVSGEEIGEALGVSRSAVWKGIRSLRDDGYKISAVTNKGYMLEDTQDVYSREEILSRISTHEIGREIKFYDSLDSTNNKAKAIGFEGGSHGTVVIAETQTAGKGRRGRKWSSPEGSGVWMSILLCPDIAPVYVPSITLAAGISVCGAINKTTEAGAKIKWPNDVIINGRKVCGILTEMSSEIDYVNFVVVGIGVNVMEAEFDESLSGIITNINREAVKKCGRSVIAAAIIEEFEKNYNVFCKGGFKSLKSKYESMCDTLNKRVAVSGSENFEGRAVGITDEGYLIVEKAGGGRVELTAGDVSIRRAD